MEIINTAQVFHPIDFSVLDFDADTSDSDGNSLPFVEVTTAEPFRIQNVSQQWLDIFQFSKEEVAGRTLRVICGPATRLGDLKQVITTAANGKEGKAPVCFYSSVGAGKMMAVKAEPSDGQPTCRLTMAPSDAVTFKEALAMEDSAVAVISAQKPFAIKHVNILFPFEFGMSQELWNGKTLRMLHGPRTDNGAFASMLQNATDGLSRTQEMVLYTSDCLEYSCEVSVVPVLGHDGAVADLMVSVKPIYHDRNNDHHPTGLSGIEAKLHSLSIPVPASPLEFDANNHCRPAAIPTPVLYEAFSSSAMESTHHAAPSIDAPLPACHSLESFSFPASPQDVIEPAASVSSDRAAAAAPKTALRLVPRKKRPASGEFVELTTARLLELSNKSMKAAAEELGIAASTLKKACRKLGWDRWPSGTQAKAKALDYDGSYVRRLLAKYKNKDPREASTSPPPSDVDGAEHCQWPGQVTVTVASEPEPPMLLQLEVAEPTPGCPEEGWSWDEPEVVGDAVMMDGPYQGFVESMQW